MHNELVSVFNFILSESVKASELKRGDIALIRSRWDMVISTKETDDNHGNLCIEGFSGYLSFIPSNLDIKIIKRDLVDTKNLLVFINKHVKEKEKQRKLDEEEETKELEKERMYLKKRLRDLGK